MQKHLDAADKLHIGGAVIASPTGAFDRLDLRKLGFPKAQHMGGHAKPIGNLADGSERLRGFGHGLSLLLGGVLVACHSLTRLPG